MSNPKIPTSAKVLFWTVFLVPAGSFTILLWASWGTSYAVYADESTALIFSDILLLCVIWAASIAYCFLAGRYFIERAKNRLLAGREKERQAQVEEIISKMNPEKKTNV